MAEHHLQFEVIDRPRRIVFLFRARMAGVGGEEGQWTRVSIDIAPLATGARLTLIHEMDPEWADYEDRTRAGWTTILASLAQILGEQALPTPSPPANCGSSGCCPRRSRPCGNI